MFAPHLRVRLTMQKSIIYITIMFLFSNWALAKDLDSLQYNQHTEFFLDWDNDFYLLTDYYYTQGASFNYIHPALRKNPVNHMLLQLKDADYYYGLGLTQEIFTPKDVHDSLINVVDRPYAGTLFIRSFAVSSKPEKRLRFTTQLDLGVMGPLAISEQTQKKIHDWLNLGSPAGWDYQIDNRPYFNYNVLFEKGLVQVHGFLDIIGTSRLRIGNIHDDLQAGVLLRIGRFNDYFKGYNLSNKEFGDNRNFQLYVFGGAKATAVLYNGTLMGGIIPPESDHQFELKEISHGVAELYGGVHLSYKSIGAKGQLTWKSREFDYGIHHDWGTVSLYLRF